MKPRKPKLHTYYIAFARNGATLGFGPNAHDLAQDIETMGLEGDIWAYHRGERPWTHKTGRPKKKVAP